MCLGQGLALRKPTAWQEAGLLASLMPLQRGCEASELGGQWEHMGGLIQKGFQEEVALS